MKVIFMGTPDFAVETLRSLKEAGHEVVLAVTQPDRPKGRGKAVAFSPVKEEALALGIPVYQPTKIRQPECVEYLRQYEADCIVVVAFGQILPQEILDMPRLGCVNVHASLLPKYRGAAPIQWAVINGERETGVTTMRMDAGLDTGDMLMKAVVPLDRKETGGSLFAKLSHVGAKLLVETLEGLEKGTVLPKPQEGESTYAKMIRKEMGRIDWTQGAEAIERLIRGLNPWPSAYTSLSGKTLKIWDAEVVTEHAPETVPGTVVSVSPGELRVQTGEGQLSLREVQLEGKKRMEIEAFLRGVRLEAGTVLG